MQPAGAAEDGSRKFLPQAHFPTNKIENEPGTMGPRAGAVCAAAAPGAGGANSLVTVRT
jgi:hypothetical protein